MKRTLITIGLVLAGASAAHADYFQRTAYDEAGARQRQQISRIEHGVRDGSLTRREADALLAEQRRIGEDHRHARADGRIDAREHAALRAEQVAAGRHIYQERHDREVASSRPWYRRWW